MFCIKKQLHPLSLLLTLCAVFAFSFISLNGVVYAENASVQVGDKLTIPFDTVSHGDAVSIFDDVVIEGELLGNAVAVFGDITVLGKVSGDVAGVFGTITLGENAIVDGDIAAVGGKLERAPGAIVGGSVNNVSIGRIFNNTDLNFNAGWLKFANPIAYILYLAALFALALLTVSLFPNHVAEVGVKMEREIGRSALIGFLSVILIGPVLVLISITIVGIPVAFLVGCAFVVAKMLGYVAFVTLLGLRILPGENRNHIGSLALGVLVLGLVRYVPIAGPLVSFVVTIITLGAVLDSRFGTNKPWLPPKQAA